MKKPLTIVVLGRSGCGKGVQIERLKNALRPLLAIHTGARFRELVGRKTLAASVARGFLAKGNLAPTWLASFMWIDALMRELDSKKNVLFDGSPRMYEEAKLLDDVLGWFGRKDIIALYIDISEREAARRLMERGRGDDHPSAIKNRLSFFTRHVMPTIKYYRRTGRLIRINGEQSVDDVSRDIAKALKLNAR